MKNYHLELDKHDNAKDDGDFVHKFILIMDREVLRIYKDLGMLNDPDVKQYIKSLAKYGSK